MQRCLSIGRRVAKPALVTAGVLLSSLETIKLCLIQSGKIEEALAKVTASKIGTHDGTSYSRENLLKTLKWFRVLIRPVITSRDSTTLARLEHAIEDMETDVSTGALRKQPYCVMLYGPPGVGKSSFAIQIARAIMMHEYGVFNSYQMVTLNETDEYQSEFRSSHKVVLFDDIAASKADHPDTKNPWRKIIDFVNNVQKTALNPNCEMKGKVYIKPDLVILTSNIDFSKGWSEVGKTMNCPEAIQRRCQKVVKLHDYSNVSFTEFSANADFNTYTLGSRPVNLALGNEELVSRSVAVEFLLEDYISHMESQDQFLRVFNGYFDDIKFKDTRYSPQTDISPKFDITLPYPSESSDDRYRKYLFEFLLKKVDWDLYWAMYQYGHTSDLYYWDGIIYESWQRRPETAICVDSSLMNDLRQYKYPGEEEYLSIPDLQAESSVGIRLDPIDSNLDDVSEFSLDDDVSLRSTEITHFGPEDDYICICPRKETRDIIEDYQLHHDEDPIQALIKQHFRLFEILDLSRSLSHKQAFDTRCRTFEILKNSDEYKVLYHASVMLVPASRDPRLLSGLVYSLGIVDAFQVIVDLDDFSDKHIYSTLIYHISRRLSTFTQRHSDIYSYLLHSDPELTFPKATIKRYRKRAMEVLTKVRSYVDETVQIDTFLNHLPYQLRNPLRTERNIKFACIGEVDLLLTYEDFYIVVEFKGIDSQRSKGRLQAIKYGEAISILQPDKRVFGLVITPSHDDVVYDNGVAFDSDPVGDYFSKLQYSPL